MAKNKNEEIEKLYRQCGKISHQELFRSIEKLHIDKDSNIVARLLARQMAFEYLKQAKLVKIPASIPNVTPNNTIPSIISPYLVTFSIDPVLIP